MTALVRGWEGRNGNMLQYVFLQHNLVLYYLKVDFTQVKDAYDYINYILFYIGLYLLYNIYDI